MNDAQTSKCSTCGYEWITGKDGSHSCQTHLLDRATSAENAIQDIHKILDQLGIGHEAPGIRARVMLAVEKVKKMMAFPLCVDCIHFQIWGSDKDSIPICNRSIKTETIPDREDLMGGGSVKIHLRKPDGCRKDAFDCGRGAKFFVPKPTQQNA